MDEVARQSNRLADSNRLVSSTTDRPRATVRARPSVDRTSRGTVRNIFCRRLVRVFRSRVSRRALTNASTRHRTTAPRASSSVPRGCHACVRACRCVTGDDDAGDAGRGVSRRTRRRWDGGRARGSIGRGSWTISGRRRARRRGCGCVDDDAWRDDARGERGRRRRRGGARERRGGGARARALD